MLQKSLHSARRLITTELDTPVNPHWLAFFRRVRELAELAHQREAQAQASVAIDPSGSQPAVPMTSKEKAPAATGAHANSLD